ncbi:MAG: hypothetical protein WD066_20270 [Planctomycetaceae bacterium]
MPTSATSSSRPAHPAEFVRGSARLTVPSWLASLVLHVGGLLLFVSTLKSCGQGGTGFERGEAFRTVGIVVKSEGKSLDQTNPETDSPEEDDAPLRAALESNANPTAVPRDAPVPLDVPRPETLGPGAPTFSPSTAGATDIHENHLLVPGKGTTGPAAGGASLVGTVSFLGIPDKATRVVYVLDRSGSMAGEPLQLAKAELIASLESLQSNQQYQVIFYNTEATAMRLDGENDALYSASDVNRTKTRQYVNGIVADAGTNDLPAILKALSFQPEVIFLLTDGEGLTAADLGRIRQSNRSDARIHCVRFGIGSELAGGGYIERLAEQNGGTYIYRDIRRSDQR